MTRESPKNFPRLYIADSDLAAGQNVDLSEGQLHYLRNVMRKSVGDRLRLFNGRDGEWLAEISDLNKKNGIAHVADKIAEQKASADIWVMASPVKKEAFDFMIEKASELGAARFMPVVCERTVVHRVNVERARVQAVEAAEQCERLDVMRVDPLSSMKDCLKTIDNERKLIFCIERSAAAPLLERLQKDASEKFAILIGPEGGFTEAEIEHISSLPQTLAVSLGSRILKAETALIYALAVLQATMEKNK